MRRIKLALIIAPLCCGISLYGTHAEASHYPSLANTTVTVAIGMDTKVLDLGKHDLAAAPRGWANVGFKDSTWSHVQRVPVSVYNCFINAYGSMSFGDSREFYDTYWGSQENHAYLFRQAFVLPRAHSYDSSYDISLPFLTDYAEVYINGFVDNSFVSGSSKNDSVQGTDTFVMNDATNLRAGHNVIGIYVSPARKMIMGQACSTLSLQYVVTVKGIVIRKHR